MAKIVGIENMTFEQIDGEVRQGAKFVYFQYCISVLILTFKRTSDIYYLRPGESAGTRGVVPSLLALFLGWWGIPWGPIWTIQSFYHNFRGGKDVTTEIMTDLHAQAQVQAQPINGNPW